MDKRKNNYPEIALLFIAASFLIYGKSLFYEFFTFDDALHILDNEKVSNPSLKNFLFIWMDSKVPIVFNFWQTISAFFGIDSPVPYRWLNILFHGLNSFLCFTLFIHFFRSIKISVEKNLIYPVLGALFFLLHPVQVESVVWVSSLKGVLSTFFGFISFHFFLLEHKTHQRKHLLLSFIFIVLSVMSKPSGVAFILLFVLIDLFLFRLPAQKVMKKNGHYLILGIGVLIFYMIEYPQDNKAVPYGTRERILMSLESLTFYIKQSFAPLKLMFNYEYSLKNISEMYKNPKPQARFMIVFLLLFFWITAYSLYKKGWRPVGVFLLMFILSVGPNLGLIYYDFQNISTVADRYLYTAIFSVCALLVYLAYKFSSYKYGKPIVVSIFSIYLAFFGYKTFARISDWSTNEKLLKKDFDQTDNVVLLESLAHAYYDKKSNNAAPYFEKLIETKSENKESYITLLELYADEGDIYRGLEVLKKSRDFKAAPHPALISEFYRKSYLFLTAKRYLERVKLRNVYYKEIKESVDEASSRIEESEKNALLAANYYLATYYKKRDISKSLNYYKNALNYAPQDFRPYIQKAVEIIDQNLKKTPAGQKDN